MSFAAPPQKDAPARQVIEYLQRNGAATIKQLEEVLGVTTTAVRQHLAALESAGYLERRKEHAGVGRPYHLYSITPKARELFACHCDDLALTLLEEVFAVEGAERAEMLLERVSTRLAQRYAASMRGATLQRRVVELAAALEEKGVLTDVTPFEGDAIVLKTYNCPYHELAEEHREICEMDKSMMRKALGSDVSLSACLMDGHGSCSFVIAKRAAQAPAEAR